MKKNNRYIPIPSRLLSGAIGIFGIFFFIVGCSTNDSEQTATNSSVVENHPNKDSELALLMRKMHADADSIKQLIVTNEGTISKEYIAALEKIHTAIPTDANVKTPEFKAYTELMVNEANALFSNEQNKKEGFNNLVDKCVQCHQSFCPGPIKKINKLRIN
jgi:hypothetical protein